MKLKKSSLSRKKIRIRKLISGTSDVPRLSVYRSNRNMYAQLIDDSKGVTLAVATFKQEDDSQKKTKVEQSYVIGKELSKKALDLGIKKCKFDRGGNVYHGRVKSLAKGAREGGLKF